MKSTFTMLLCAALGGLGCGSDGGDATVDAAGGGADAAVSPDAPLVDAPGAADAAISVDATTTPDAMVSNPDAALPPAGSITAPPYLMWPTTTEVSVRWETASPTIGRVDYGPTPSLGSSMVEPAAVTSHELRLTGLAPGQLNYYQIGFDGYALPPRSVHTAPANASTAPFEFLVFGDNQNGPTNFSAMIPHMVSEDARFAFSVGDCVQNGTRQEYRDQLFTPIAPLADHVPFLVAAGNHERYSDSNAALFDEYMSQPGDEHCFGWRYGSLYIVFIDSELSIDPGTTQGDCIAAALSSADATTATFQAAAFHKPPRIEWWFGGLIAFPAEMEAPWIRETLEPILESYGVDVVFNGHNHLYAHTPETPGGITWVTTGGAGGGLDTSFALWRVGTWPQITTTLHEHHFLSARVDGGTMTIRAIDIDGNQIHQFTVTP